jgi:hypothetical protein
MVENALVDATPISGPAIDHVVSAKNDNRF